MFLRDLDIYADKELVERFQGGFVTKFHRDTCCIVEHYLELIRRKAPTQQTAKVHFTFTDRLTGKQSPQLLGKGSSCVSVTWTFDFDRYHQEQTPACRKEMIALAFNDALLWTASRCGWVLTPFQEAYAALLDQDLKWTGLTKKSWLSPNRKYRVRIHFEFELESIELFAVLFENRRTQELMRVPLGSAIPESNGLADVATVGRWIANSRFELSDGLLLRKRIADFSSAMAE